MWSRWSQSFPYDLFQNSSYQTHSRVSESYPIKKSHFQSLRAARSYRSRGRSVVRGVVVAEREAGLLPAKQSKGSPAAAAASAVVAAAPRRPRFHFR